MAGIGASLAFQIVSVAVGWQVYALSGSALDLGLIGLAQFLPMAALTLVATRVLVARSRFGRELHLAFRELLGGLDGVAIAALARASEKLRGGHARAGLDELIQAWRSHPASELAALIERLDEHLVRLAPAPKLGGSIHFRPVSTLELQLHYTGIMNRNRFNNCRAGCTKATRAR